MEEIAAGGAAASMLAEHKANVRSGRLVRPDGPTTIPDATISRRDT